jgi:hypothetical protein
MPQPTFRTRLPRRIIGLALGAFVVAAAPARAHTITLSGFTGNASASFAGTPRWAGGEVAYAYDGPRWAAQGGLRVAGPFEVMPLPLELFVRFLFTLRVGLWEPQVGPEAGLSGLAVFSPPPSGRPTDFFDAEQRTLGPVYVAIHTAPLRFVWKDRFVASALELRVGTSLSGVGATLRTQLGLLTLGVRW